MVSRTWSLHCELMRCPSYAEARHAARKIFPKIFRRAILIIGRRLYLNGMLDMRIVTVYTII